MLTQDQERAIRAQHAQATEAQQRAIDEWRRLHRIVDDIYIKGQIDRPRTTSRVIGDAVGVSAQQVSRWRQKAHEHE